MQSLPENDNVPIRDICRTVNELINNLSAIDPAINKNCGKAEPKANLLKAAKLAYADGTLWSPGSSGEGYYYRNQAGNWTKL